MKTIFETPARSTEDDLITTVVFDKVLAKYGEADEEHIRSILALCGKKIVSAIKKDLKNRYSLTEDWLLPPVNVALPSYDDGWLAIEPLDNGTSLILVYAYTSDKEHDHCDGATFFPDKVKGVLAGALFHDIWYERMEFIAKAWGWKVSKVRKLGDKIFASIMMEEKGNSFVVNFCYYSTRIFGGVFHSIMKIKWLKKLLVVFAVLCVLGLGGCVQTVFSHEDGYEYVPPTWVENFSVFEDFMFSC